MTNNLLARLLDSVAKLVLFVATRLVLTIDFTRKTMSRHYSFLSRQSIRKGTNPRSVVVVTFNEGTTKQLAHK